MLSIKVVKHRAQERAKKRANILIINKKSIA